MGSGECKLSGLCLLAVSASYIDEPHVLGYTVLTACQSVQQAGGLRWAVLQSSWVSCDCQVCQGLGLIRFFDALHVLFNAWILQEGDQAAAAAGL